MANYVEVKITGLRELTEALKAFGPKLARNGIRAATYAGAKVVRDAARASHPAFTSRSGQLEANIIAAKRRGNNEKEAIYRVTVRGKVKKYANTAANRRRRRVGKRYTVEGPAFYGKFLEFGTSRMGAHPFLRPAFLANSDNALEAMKARLAKAVSQAAGRA